MRIMNKYPSTLTVSALGLIFTLVFGAFWTLTLVGAYVKYHPNGDGQDNPACDTPGGTCSSAALIIVLIFISLYPRYFDPNHSLCGVLHLRNHQECHSHHNLRYFWFLLRILFVMYLKLTSGTVSIHQAECPDTQPGVPSAVA
jgi:hypothetical protein